MEGNQPEEQRTKRCNHCGKPCTEADAILVGVWGKPGITRTEYTCQSCQDTHGISVEIMRQNTDKDNLVS
jgi:hypothetical protein